jgi:hypothetical protein
MAVGFLPLLLLGHTSAYSSMSMWGGFALWAALIWERTPRALLVVGLGFLVLVGATLGALTFFAPQIPARFAPAGVPLVSWLELRRMLGITSVALGICAALAAYFAGRRRPEIALVAVLVSMIPIGLCLAESVSRMAPSFSLAGAARFLNPRLAEQGQVLFEGPLHRGSTLAFYLNRKFFLVNQQPDYFDRGPESQAKYLDEGFVLEVWNRSVPVYLIIDESRIPHWQELITARVHIFHQVTTSGHHVVLSNQL